MNTEKSAHGDFVKFFVILKQHYKFICSFVIFFVFISIVFSLQLQNKYKSDSKIVAIADDSKGGLGALAGKFGGLASMAGVSLGGKSDVNLLMDTIKSRDFLKSFIKKEQISVQVFAAKGWDSEKNTLFYQEKLYDVSNKTWVREPEGLRGASPSDEEVYKKFSELVSLSRNKKTDLLTVSITYYSPYLAQQWLNSLLSHLSEFLRNKDKEEARKSILYLTEQQEIVAISELKEVFSDLLKEQHQKLMLANIKEVYGFEIRDSSYFPEEKHSPKRSIIVILSAFISLILAVALVFLREFFRAVKNV